MSTKVLAVLTLVLGLGAWLAWTNPTSKGYEAFQDELMSQAVARVKSSGDGTKAAILKQLVESRGGLFFKSLVRSQTTRRNLFVCSLFETKLLGSRIVVLGIGGKFFPLTDVEEALRQIEKAALSRK